MAQAVHLIQVPILLEQLCPVDTVHIQITSSTPATSMVRRRLIGIATAAIGRLLCTITTLATTCTCIAPMSPQVPVASIRTAAALLGVC